MTHDRKRGGWRPTRHEALFSARLAADLPRRWYHWIGFGLSDEVGCERPTFWGAEISSGEPA